MGEKSGGIRLTNKTAVALRKSAVRVRRGYIAFGVCATLSLAAAAVWFGAHWLPAVPVFVASAVLLDVALSIRAERVFLEMTAQAVCAEQAIRALRALDQKESIKKRQRRMDCEAGAAMAEEASARLHEREASGSAQAGPAAIAAPGEPSAGQGDEPDRPHRQRRRRTALTIMGKEA